MQWSKTLVTKCLLLSVVLLISLQYLVNVALLRQNDSVILLNIIDASIGKVWNQTNLFSPEHMRSSVTTSARKLRICDAVSPHLKGHIKVNTQVAAWIQLEEENTNLQPGGRYQPADCVARNRVAIVIPFRDRDIHLKIFMRNIHPFLQSQQLDYGIFIVEMAANITFNRALLMNVGFVEAMKKYNYECFIFHDVDLIPEDDRNLYTCPTQPRHMSVAIDSLKYKLPYRQIFGGVSAITTEHFKKINGFSNIFFGWGEEDDDMYRRLILGNLTVTRYSPEVGRYKMLVHVKDHGNPDRLMLLKTVKARQQTDGLTSLKYNVIKTELRPLYTWILISVNQSEIVESEPIHKRLMNNLKNLRDQHRKDIKDKTQTVNNKVGGSVVKVIDDKGGKSGPIDKGGKSVLIGKGSNPSSIDKGAKSAQIEKGGKLDTAGGVKSEPVDKGVKSGQVDNGGKSGPINTNAQKPVQTQNNIPQNSDQVKANSKPKIINQQKAEIKKPVPKVKARNPIQISWIPTDFKGILPMDLTKFQPLPVREVKKKTPPKQAVARKNIANVGKVVANAKRPNAGQNIIRNNANNRKVVANAKRPNAGQFIVRNNVNVGKAVINAKRPDAGQSIVRNNVNVGKAVINAKRPNAGQSIVRNNVNVGKAISNAKRPLIAGQSIVKVNGP